MEEKDIENIKKELEEQKKLAEDYLNKWKRERADFINFKRDECERIQGAVEMTEKDIVKDFLPILDNLNLLEKHNSDKIEGISNLKKQAFAFLEKMGVKEIEALDKEFNPHLHEAVQMIEGEFEVPTVVEELQKGYIMNDKIIRAAKVKVARKK